MHLWRRFVWLLAVTPAMLFAQIPSTETGDDIKAVPKAFLEDEWRIWSSPFRVDNYDTHTVVKYILPFTAIAGGLMAGDTKLADSLPNTLDQGKWSGRVSDLGGAAALGGFTAGTYLLGHFTHNQHAAETGLLALEALGHAQIVTFGIKQATNRERPDAPDVKAIGFWEGGNSFPSGHAASVFAVAAVYSYEYRNHIAVPIVAYSAASLISLSRIGARRHWASDVFVGGSIGFLVGRYTYKRNHRVTPVRPSLRQKLTPEIELGATPSLLWSF